MNDREILLKLVKNPKLHARFINTLSFMEYIGARKIVKSQDASSLSSEVLKHMSEEIRHARLLKSLAMRLSDNELDTYGENHLLCGNMGEQYLQTIDRAVEAELGEKNPRVNYLLSTLLIEERAQIFYPVYESVLNELGYGHVVATIMRDEENHLQEMRDALLKENRLTEKQLSDLRAMENKTFGDFMNAVSGTVS